MIRSSVLRRWLLANNPGGLYFAVAVCDATDAGLCENDDNKKLKINTPKGPEDEKGLL